MDRPEISAGNVLQARVQETGAAPPVPLPRGGGGAPLCLLRPSAIALGDVPAAHSSKKVRTVCATSIDCTNDLGANFIQSIAQAARTGVAPSVFHLSRRAADRGFWPGPPCN